MLLLKKQIIIIIYFCVSCAYSSLIQAQAYKGVDRDPYSGDVAKVANSMKKELGLGPIDGETPNKGAAVPRGHQGVRDLHESSFSLSGRKKSNWCNHLKVQSVIFGLVYDIHIGKSLIYFP